jgi:hypothetical protein
MNGDAQGWHQGSIKTESICQPTRLITACTIHPHSCRPAISQSLAQFAPKGKGTRVYAGSSEKSITRNWDVMIVFPAMWKLQDARDMVLACLSLTWWSFDRWRHI